MERINGVTSVISQKELIELFYNIELTVADYRLGNGDYINCVARKIDDLSYENINHHCPITRSMASGRTYEDGPEVRITPEILEQYDVIVWHSYGENDDTVAYKLPNGKYMLQDYQDGPFGYSAVEMIKDLS